MKKRQLITFSVIILMLTGCVVQRTADNGSSHGPTASPTSSPANNNTAQLTLPVLDALLADNSFVSQLKSNLNLSDEQVSSLKKISGEDVARLRQGNAEEGTADAAEARSQASNQISAVIGNEKAGQLEDLARDFWAKGTEEPEGTIAKEAAAELSKTPNQIPSDTRIVVNAPSFRMDLFKNGSLLKSYKIGIGYPEFPLPQGLRKAQTIIFNPTWTPPDSPWVANMKNVSPGQTIEAGSELNPLGPIKIPIGLPSLIHGGKAVTKLGGFASHGCVGLTNGQVKDFAKLLAQASGTEVSDKTIATYLADKTRTRVVKLNQTVPVELRYETIVAEDGKLHIYKDVYERNTNTEENLRAVLEANGLTLNDLSADDRTKALDALNSMSAHPRKVTPTPLDDPKSNKNANRSKTKPTPVKNQKEVVLTIAALAGHGYPAPVNLDAGTGKPAERVVATAGRR